MLAVTPAAGAKTHVLRVGTYRGVRGQYHSIQRAVDAAHRGDWILIGPGDYHPRADYSKRHHAPADESGAGVLIQTKGLHIRGMNRNRVSRLMVVENSNLVGILSLKDLLDFLSLKIELEEE